MNKHFNKIYFLLIILLLMPIESCKTKSDQSYTVEEKTIEVNDKTYYYAIAIPHGYRDSDSYPLMLALHWGEAVHFQTGISFLSTFILPTLEDFNGIIISPSCPEPENIGWIHENSETFILALISQIKTDYNIEASKIAISGYSMGGIGTWFYAVTYPDIFSLAVPIASRPPSSIRPITDIIPTYVIHGENDEIFSINSVRDIVRDIKLNTNSIRLVEVENATHYETNKYKEYLSESLKWIEDKWQD